MKEICEYNMLYWALQVTLCSIIFILLIHNIIHFLKTTLTVPKVKDLVNTRNQKYENIYNIVKDNPPEYSYSIDELLPKNENDTVSASASMKDELKNFLKKQLNHDDTTEISALDSYSNL
jgi:hypothetical protein